MQGGYRQPCIEVKNATKKGYLEAFEGDGIDISQMVRVRRCIADIEKLKKLLKDAKRKNNITNEEIARMLDIPITTIEHWFRKDNCFSIPLPNVWLKLKEILKIETDEFDKSIMTFEEREGTYEKANRCYLDDGLSPTLTTSDEIKVIGNYMPSRHNASRIVDSDGLAQTVKENHGTVTATNINLKIRKLTPKECWRLMGFDDEDFEKAEKVNSNTQLYKQAGNSIVVNVLEEIFKMLF